MKLIIDIPDKEWEEWKNGLGIIHTKPLTEALEKAKPLQAELENIKAEIQNERKNNQGVGRYAYTAGLKFAIDSIDNHINKADCDNDCEHCDWTECPKE